MNRLRCAAEAWIRQRWILDTLESLYVPGLYFAGEILDVDGMCGGYNLTFAWASGYVAGRSAAARTEENKGRRR